jgi:hypothetical protein
MLTLYATWKASSRGKIAVSVAVVGVFNPGRQKNVLSHAVTMMLDPYSTVQHIVQSATT